jgi:hypothetical protein
MTALKMAGYTRIVLPILGHGHLVHASSVRFAVIGYDAGGTPALPGGCFRSIRVDR